jgi:hypothetical protein
MGEARRRRLAGTGPRAKAIPDSRYISVGQSKMDLSRAKSSCRSCYGTGLLGVRNDGKSKTRQLLVCRCVPVVGDA